MSEAILKKSTDKYIFEVRYDPYGDSDILKHMKLSSFVVTQFSKCATCEQKHKPIKSVWHMLNESAEEALEEFIKLYAI